MGRPGRRSHSPTGERDNAITWAASGIDPREGAGIGSACERLWLLLTTGMLCWAPPIPSGWWLHQLSTNWVTNQGGGQCGC